MGSSPRLENLAHRARMLQGIRAFFMARGVLEVETPILGVGGVADATLTPLVTQLEEVPGGPQELYLLTSPEVFMKRLLAAGSGPIYQLTRAFRQGEVGARHNHEFSILEWYRPGWDHLELMAEVEGLLRELTGAPPARRVTYRDVFCEATGLDPFGCDVPALRATAAAHGVCVPPGMPEDETAPWEDLLLGELVEPSLASGPPVFVTDYPAGRAALARVKPGDPPTEERFELYWRGLELANGFRELTDAEEQARRFHAINEARAASGRRPLALDQRFLEALPHMPEASGVAVGVDRLVMASLGTMEIADVVAFPHSRL